LVEKNTVLDGRDEREEGEDQYRELDDPPYEEVGSTVGVLGDGPHDWMALLSQACM